MKGLGWFRVASDIAWDDDLEHVSDAAFRTFLELIGYSAYHLTDGVVPLRTAQKRCNTRRVADALRELGERGFVKLETEGEALVRILNYGKYQQTRAEVESCRANGRDRVTRYRTVTNTGCNAPQSKSKSKKKEEPPSLVDMARSMAGWKERTDDEQSINSFIAIHGRPKVERVIRKLATDQAVKAKYKDCRATLGNWLKTEFDQPGDKQIESADEYNERLLAATAYRPEDML